MFTVRIPWEVSLSILDYVEVFGFPISVKVFIIDTSTCLLWNIVPVSASLSESMTVRMVLHSVRIIPFGVGFGLVGDAARVFLRYKFPADLVLCIGLDKVLIININVKAHATGMETHNGFWLCCLIIHKHSGFWPGVCSCSCFL